MLSGRLSRRLKDGFIVKTPVDINNSATTEVTTMNKGFLSTKSATLYQNPAAVSPREFEEVLLGQKANLPSKLRIAGMNVRPDIIAKDIPKASIGPNTWNDRKVAKQSANMARMVVKAEERIAGLILVIVSAILSLTFIPKLSCSLNLEEMNSI